MKEHQTTDELTQRRIVLQAAGFAMVGGLVAPTSATPDRRAERVRRAPLRETAGRSARGCRACSISGSRCRTWTAHFRSTPTCSVEPK